MTTDELNTLLIVAGFKPREIQLCGKLAICHVDAVPLHRGQPIGHGAMETRFALGMFRGVGAVVENGVGHTYVLIGRAA